MKKRKKCDWIVGRSGCPDIEECKECVQKYYCKGYRYVSGLWLGYSLIAEKRKRCGYMRDNGRGEK